MALSDASNSVIESFWRSISVKARAASSPSLLLRIVSRWMLVFTARPASSVFMPWSVIALELRSSSWTLVDTLQISAKAVQPTSPTLMPAHTSDRTTVLCASTLRRSWNDTPAKPVRSTMVTSGSLSRRRGMRCFSCCGCVLSETVKLRSSANFGETLLLAMCRATRVLLLRISSVRAAAPASLMSLCSRFSSTTDVFCCSASHSAFTPATVMLLLWRSTTRATLVLASAAARLRQPSSSRPRWLSATSAILPSATDWTYCSKLWKKLILGAFSGGVEVYKLTTEEQPYHQRGSLLELERGWASSNGYTCFVRFEGRHILAWIGRYGR
jgi:hypothetical protein